MSRLILCFCLLFTFSICSAFSQSSSAASSSTQNVIFISIDDLNDWINPLELGGLKGLKTPNFDRLRQMSMSFTNAHIPAAACAPSRVAIMTGVSSARSGVTGWRHANWRQVPALKDVVTLEQFFKDKGYTTLAGGKIYHTLAPPRAVVNQSEAKGWDYYYPSLRIPIPFQVRAPEAVISPKNFTGTQPDYFTWGPIAQGDEFMADYHIVDWANYELSRKHEKPLFLAVGLTKPHDPWEVPQKYFDMYPLESVPDLEIKEDDLEDAFVHGRRPLHKFIEQNNQIKKVVQAYMATISFTDAMLGRLLDGIEKSAYANNSIIVLWSDHGMHMGEKENWEKFTLWERSTRAPLFIKAPGVTKGGSTTHVPVSMLDIFPTLVDLIGEKIPEYCDGESLVPMLKNQSFAHKPALTSYEMKLERGPAGFSAHTIRTMRYRYIYYPLINFEELYDHENDKNEWDNIAYKPSSRGIIEEHRKLMQQQVPDLKWTSDKPVGYTIFPDGTVKKDNYVSIKDISADTPWY
jgi:arylsulfatase A-like enzyme